MASIAEDQLPFFQCFVGTRVPQGTIDKAFDECTYEVFKNGIFLPNRVLKTLDKNLIFLHPDFFSWAEKRRVRAVLHETAHYVLRHKCRIEGISEQEYEDQENEAWEKVEEWMKGWLEKERLENEIIERSKSIFQQTKNLVRDAIQSADKELLNEIQDILVAFKELINEAQHKVDQVV